MELTDSARRSSQLPQDSQSLLPWVTTPSTTPSYYTLMLGIWTLVLMLGKQVRCPLSQPQCPLLSSCQPLQRTAAEKSDHQSPWEQATLPMRLWKWASEYPYYWRRLCQEAKILRNSIVMGKHLIGNNIGTARQRQLICVFFLLPQSLTGGSKQALIQRHSEFAVSP